MKFCPKCERRMKPKIEEGILSCPKCGLIIKREEEYIGDRVVTTRGQDQTSQSAFKIMEGDRSLETMPTTAVDCPKCKNDSAYWWLLQTRSADEPTTQFYRCTKCTHTWRNYA